MNQPKPTATIALWPITEDNLRDILKLEVTEAQKQFVASNAVSVAQAHYDPTHAWYRAIYADETPVGFVMLYDDPYEPEYFLWRFMIAAPYQRLGYGRRALQLVVDYVKTRPQATALYTSFVPADGGPGPFYRKFGFVETGEVMDEENVARLDLVYDDDEELAPPAGRPLTHVVMFKLKDRRPEASAELAERLRGLDGAIPTLRRLEVGVNIIPADRAYDVVLIAHFEDRAGLEAYQKHPVHLPVLAYTREAAESITVVDYET
jgi:diamine N-acetyltransferase